MIAEQKWPDCTGDQGNVMDHIAILRKDWKLLPKILSGKKKIESRWYMARYPPWGRIQAGDVVYFKDSGDLVRIKAEVEKVLSFANYTEKELKEILDKYGKDVDFVSPIDEVYNWAKERKYCILIFLKNPKEITPFEINKAGFGNACAWMCVRDIEKVKV